MGIPFQRLIPLGKGSIVCAARGCSIHTFDLAAKPQLLFSWAHPSSKQAQSGRAAPGTHEDDRNKGQPEQQGPPPKRRKLGSDATEANVEAEDGQGTSETPTKGPKNGKKANAKWTPPKPEATFVVLLAATDDGSHVIAVTGQDKTLWVFEHDGKGSLKKVSQRVMPKRPSSLALAAGGQVILSADKFGDVYALPLLEHEGEQPGSTPATLASSTPTAAPAPAQPLRGANVFTVHSQRNRRALEDQQRQRETNAKLDLPKEGPKFVHEVLLGHVSMLTSMVTAKDSQNRPYIITADRDEHIRVSRGMPQSHVIETYCQGHASFINTLCIPASHPDILISGGGDHELFVWDWLAGKPLGTVDLLSHVRNVLPEASKIAVVKLLAYEAEGECYLIAICERVPALFIFMLQSDKALSYKGMLELRGNPLDVATVDAADQMLLAAIDPAEGDGEVTIFKRDGDSWAPSTPIANISDADGQLVLSREDLDKALYTVENLRKTDYEASEDEAYPETPEQGQ
ncbi:hypothetical protein F4861DRAFT_542156 [Xylaria intraflava]|nr:hypothetical protein F4861DRAFT_542156 [Xylaria intraflava]